MLRAKIKKIAKIKSKGVTLIEVIVCVAIFAILSVSVYGVFTSIIKGIVYYREKTTISALADQYLEIARNMPYSQIGVVNGNPSGTLPSCSDPPACTTTPIVSVNGTNYKIYYSASYVDDSADGTALAGTDPAPNDYKQIKLYIKNTGTGVINSFFTNIAPKGLEGLANGGALFLHVSGAFGQDIPGATLRITNNTVGVDLTRTADATGHWIEVGLPNSANSYHIVASKIVTDGVGYSRDQTYPVSVSNPSPTPGDSTISNGQITSVTLQIDQLSNLVFSTLNQTCVPITGVGVEVQGTKKIGAPNVLKFDNNYTSNGSGNISLSNIEWDSYTPLLQAGSPYIIYGYSPSQYINVSPDTSQSFNIILGPKSNNSLLVIVKDSATGNPLQSAQVDLKDQFGNTVATKLTDGSIWSQQSWSGGSGQEDFADPAKYYEDDGGIDNAVVPSGMRLASTGPSYVSFGSLTSSTFDTGTSATSYSSLTWEPANQDPAVGVKFQIAANNDNLTWYYKGPDGTNSSYYTSSGSSINTSNININNNRYIRYKVFLSTTDSSKTPVLTSVNISYTSGCSTPGQAIFPNLQHASYQVTINMSGYQALLNQPADVSGNTVLQFLLSQN